MVSWCMVNLMMMMMMYHIHVCMYVCDGGVNKMSGGHGWGGPKVEKRGKEKTKVSLYLLFPLS